MQNIFLSFCSDLTMVSQLYSTVCKFVGFLEIKLNIHGSGLNQTPLESTAALSLLDMLQKAH